MTYVGFVVVLLSSLLASGQQVSPVLLATGPPVATGPNVVCICRCCYLGDCKPLVNATWTVNQCSECTNDFCHNYVGGDLLRRKTARIFETLQDGVPVEQKRATIIDVCEIVSVLEATTCPTSDDSSCKRTTDVQADCYDRSASLHKYFVWSFVWLLFGGVVLGFTKNYIPALQHFNRQHFDY